MDKIVNDAKTHFNKDEDCFSKKQLIRVMYLFHWVVVQEWVVEKNNAINFYPFHKLLVKICVTFYHEYWKQI